MAAETQVKSEKKLRYKARCALKKADRYWRLVQKGTSESYKRYYGKLANEASKTSAELLRRADVIHRTGQARTEAPAQIITQVERKRSATQKFIEQYPDCCFCGGLRLARTREHMPPKSLFDSSHRPDKLIMPACVECNHGTSTADLVASIISRWRLNLSKREHIDHRRLVARVRERHPELIAEWTSLTALQRFEAKLQLQKYGVPVPQNAGMASIGRLTIRQLNLFAHKAALGLYFEHFRKVLPNEGRVSALWRSKEDFAKEGMPADLFVIMKRYGTLQQGTWNTKEVFEYRYEFNEQDGLFACMAHLRGGLFVAGFAARDAAMVESDPAKDWIRPSDLLGMMSDPRFEKKAGREEADL
jgi:hypothetical protein